MLSRGPRANETPRGLNSLKYVQKYKHQKKKKRAMDPILSQAVDDKVAAALQAYRTQSEADASHRMASIFSID